MLGGCADNMLLVGVQPVDLEDYGGSLRDAVRACIPEALTIAADYLNDRGFALTRRDTPVDGGVMTPGLELDRYEADRPDQHQACRIGDARVLQRSLGP